jgi:adenylate cyclase
MSEPMHEVERKFRVDALPEGWPDYPAAGLRQGYLSGRDDATEVRLRDADGQRSLTVKRGTGAVREEVEVALSAEQFDRLWPLTAGARLAKRRHRVPLAQPGATAEVDVYEGALAALRVVEVEFSSLEAAAAFSAPAWFGAELTGDARFSNRRLAYDGLPG